MSAEDAAGGFADSAKSGLTSKIGGVPFYVYGIGFVVAFWGYKKFVASKTAAAPVVTTALVHPGGLPTVTGDTSGAGLTGSSGFVTGSSGGVNQSNTLAGQLDAPTWINQATAYLAALGYDGTKANQYLASYATGAQQTGEGKRYVDIALNRFGAPSGNTPIVPTQHSIVQLIAPANSPAIFAQWEDGTLHWLANPEELDSVVATHPDLAYNDGSPRINILPSSDPLFASGVDYGNPGKAAYDQAVQSYTQGNSRYQPFWAQSSYVSQHANS